MVPGTQEVLSKYCWMNEWSMTDPAGQQKKEEMSKTLLSQKLSSMHPVTTIL